MGKQFEDLDVKVQESIDGMIKAEETAIAQRDEFKKKRESKIGNDVDRRKFLTVAATAAGVGAAAGSRAR